MKITEYAIVTAYDEYEFEKAVNKWIQNGYIPQGGVCFESNEGNTSIQYCQAMVLMEDELND